MRHDSPYPVKQVFSNMEFLGWYSIGDLPTEEDTNFHKQVRAFTMHTQHHLIILKITINAVYIHQLLDFAVVC